MVMVGSTPKPGQQWYHQNANARDEDILSNKLSNKGLLRGISKVASPRSSYGFEMYDRNSNHDGAGQYSTSRRARGEQTLNNLVKEMLLEFFAQK